MSAPTSGQMEQHKPTQFYSSPIRPDIDITMAVHQTYATPDTTFILNLEIALTISRTTTHAAPHSAL